MADTLLQRAKEAADKLHSDTSVSMGSTLARLEDLRGHIDVLIEAVNSSMSEEDE